MQESLEIWNSMHALSEAILRAKSSIEELQRWCRTGSIGDGSFVQSRAQDGSAVSLDAESLEALYPFVPGDRTGFRRFRLSTAGFAIAEAFAWCFPARPDDNIYEQMAKAEGPFGGSGRHSDVQKRTFLVRRASLERLRGAVDPASVAFEHKAVLYRGDGVPLGVIHEQFLLSLYFREAGTLTASTFETRSPEFEVLA